MQTIAQSAAPFPIDGILEKSATLTAAERKLFTQVNDELGSINRIAERSRFRGMAHAPGPLEDEIGMAHAKLSESPSAENAEALHALLVRKRDTEISANAISQALAPATRRTIDRLIPIATRIIDDAQKAFDADADAHAETLAKGNTSFADDRSTFDHRRAATAAAFDAKRKWIENENASAHFLMELGIV